jgi:hypothetical protein
MENRRLEKTIRKAGRKEKAFAAEASNSHVFYIRSFTELITLNEGVQEASQA